MYTLTITKLLFAISILLLTLISGLAFWRLDKASERLTIAIDAFASGIFLGVALLHALPEAVEKFSEVGDCHFPVVYLISTATYLFLIFSERSILLYEKKGRGQKHWWLASALVGLLTFHSVIEGAAIGMSGTFFGALVVFIAVFAHKGLESFALAVNLYRRFSLSKIAVRRLIAFFSLMTPLGIVIASYVVLLSESTGGKMVAAVFNAIYAGTFLYLSTEHLFEGEKSFTRPYEVFALGSGVGLMALVAMVV